MWKQHTGMAQLRHDNRVSAANEHAKHAQADIKMRMSILMTQTQRDNREQAEIEVREAFLAESALAATDLEAGVAEADAARAVKDAEAQSKHDTIVAEVGASLVPYRKAADRYGDEVAAEAARKRKEHATIAEKERDARVEKLRLEANKRIAELTEEGQVEIAAAEVEGRAIEELARSNANDATRWMNSKLAGRIVRAERQVEAREKQLENEIAECDARLSERAEAAISLAAARADHDSPHISVISGDIGDGGATPWMDGHFDSVLVLDSFVAFWPSLPHALNELRRVVKPAGTVICAVELERLRQASKAGVIPSGCPLDLQDICQAFREAGFLPRLMPGLAPAALVAAADSQAAESRALAIKHLRDSQVSRRHV